MVNKAIEIKIWNEKNFLRITAKILHFVARRLEKRSRDADYGIGQDIGYEPEELAGLAGECNHE